MVPVKVVSLARKIPSEDSSLDPTLLGLSTQTAVTFGFQKEVKAISTLVFSRESKLLGFIAQRHQRNPKSRWWRVCSWKCQALLWAGTGSVLESPQKMFPTLISRGLLGDFLWYRKLYCCIHRTSSHNFGEVRVSSSNTRNYMVWLHIYLFSVICRSSLFSLQIKKNFKNSCLCFTCDVITTIKNSEAVPRSRAAFWLT